MKKYSENKSVDPVWMVILSGGYTATESFYKQIKQQVEEVIPAMQRDVSFTVEMLCGHEFWSQLSIQEQRLAGRCMATMVTREELPLVFEGCPHAHPKKYKLK